MRRYSNNDQISIDVDKSASRIELKAVHVEAPSMYSDEDGAAVSGTEIYAMPSTSTREQYLEYLNEAKDVFVTDLGHTVDVEDLSGIWKRAYRSKKMAASTRRMLTLTAML